MPVKVGMAYFHILLSCLFVQSLKALLQGNWSLIAQGPLQKLELLESVCWTLMVLKSFHSMKLVEASRQCKHGKPDAQLPRIEDPFLQLQSPWLVIFPLLLQLRQRGTHRQ